MKHILLFFSAFLFFTSCQKKVECETVKAESIVMASNYTLTKEDIKNLATLSPDVDAFLKAKYPELFKEPQDLSTLKVFGQTMFGVNIGWNAFILERAQSGMYANKGFRLNTFWEWQFEKDEFGQTILVPYKKQ